MEQQRERVAYLDQLRFIATIGVVVLHVYAKGFNLAFGTYNWYVNVIGDSFVRWAVPIFVMISGALFLNPNREVTIKAVLKKYVPRLLWAYVFWWVMYSLILIVRSLVIGNPIKVGFFGPHFHLWFLPMLMGVYLLIPILRKITIDGILLRYALVVWFVFTTVGFLLFGGWAAKFDQITPLFKMNIIIGYAGYFMLGYYFSLKQLTEKQRIYIYIYGVLGALVCLAGNLGMSYYQGEPNDTFQNNLSPHVIGMSLALFVFVKENSSKIQKKLGRVVAFVRKDLFGIYLTHCLWLLFLYKSEIIDVTNHAITLPILCVIIFVLSLFTSKLIRLVPFLRRFVE